VSNTSALTPVVTLLTDFGLRDHFAGVLQGALLSVCPAARIVDISHEVTAFDILEGAFLLAQSWRYFPVGTIHVVVVDPGVGSNRRPIIVQAAGHIFVAPDNGVLSMVYGEEEHAVWHASDERFFRQPVSQTFHGRDVFAPIAGHLALGVAPGEFGPAIDDYMRLPIEKPVRTARRGWTGAVLKIDRFGNMITNFRADEFARVYEQDFEVLAGLRAIEKVQRNYAAAFPGEIFFIEGSSGYFEIAASQASAAKILGCGVGAPIELRLL